MMQFYPEGSKFVLVGITKRNVDKLINEEPMMIKLQRPVEEVILVYGETKPEILNYLHKEIEMQIPDWMRKEAERDPD